MKVLRKISSITPAVDYLTNRIGALLDEDKNVLWLLQGGSSIALEVAVAKKLTGRPNALNLTLSLADERFGSPNHSNSNWAQLLQAGLNPKSFNYFPVLEGDDLKKTVEKFSSKLNNAMRSCDFVLVMAGIGPDGHTIGIKRGSPAIGSKELVTGYEWDDYTRITGAAQLLKRADEVVSYAMGAEKQPVLEKLREDLPAQEQPAQLLKLAPQVIIFNEYLEGSI